MIIFAKMIAQKKSPCESVWVCANFVFSPHLLSFLSFQFLSFQLSALLRLCVSVCVCGQFDNSLIAFSVPASRLLFQGLIHMVLFQMTLCAPDHRSGSAPCGHLKRSVPAPPGCKSGRRIYIVDESYSLQANPKDWAPCRRSPRVYVYGCRLSLGSSYRVPAYKGAADP